jgi:hypothetical protein
MCGKASPFGEEFLVFSGYAPGSNGA